MIQIEKEEVVKYRCSEHGAIQGSECRFCDKCEHGITANGHCEKCKEKYGRAWANEPIDRKEFDWIRRQVGSCGLYRSNPHPRCFETLNLVDKMVLEYGRFRGFI